MDQNKPVNASPENENQKKSEEDEIQTLKDQQHIYDQDLANAIPNDTDMNLYKMIKSFAKTISPTNPFYKICLPIDFIQPISILERYSCARPEYFLDDIQLEKSAFNRFLRIFSWECQHWYPINRPGINAAKPYNPILGEFFMCEWIHEADDSRTYYLAEQVSHHPPVSTFHCENLKRKFVYKGNIYPAIKLGLNFFTVDIKGKFSVDLEEVGETYLIGNPKVAATGIFYGKLRIEIYDRLKIECKKTGYRCDMKFHTGKKEKGKISGFIFHNDKKICSLQGNIKDKIIMKGLVDGYEEFENKKEKVIIDFSKLTKVEKKIANILEQKKNESRKNWHNVTYQLCKGDLNQAHIEKYKIEDRQRKFRNDRKEKKLKWDVKYFEKKNEIELAEDNEKNVDIIWEIKKDVREQLRNGKFER